MLTRCRCCPGTMVQIGMNSEDGEKPYYGVFLNISTSITYPNATQVPFISTSNYNPINVDSPQSCNGSPSGAFGSIQLNETGQYTARWTYTWVFPKSTNSTGNSFTCTGFGSTEELNIQKTFNVTAADGSTHPPAITPTASTEATFSVSPTGTVYVMRNSGAGTLQRQSTQRLVGSSILVAVALLFA